MEITKENFADAIKSDEFKTDILPLLTEADAIKTIIDNKAEAVYKSKIDDEVKTIHSRYDDDIFEVLGVRPGTKDGVKQKTYDFLKSILTDHKGLLDKKGSLEKDQAVIDLKAQIKTLEEGGGGKHVQEIFDQAKADWMAKEADYKATILETQNSTLDLQKSTAFANAKAQLKFNPDVSEAIRNMVINAAEKEMIANSKIEDGKLVFLDASGKPVLNAEYKPKDAFGVLSSMDAIKDISLKIDDKSGGGGADPKINGSIHTTTVEGKDTKKLVLPEGSFKTKSEFIDVAEKALIDAGISRRDADWDRLKNGAYQELKVAELPA